MYQYISWAGRRLVSTQDGDELYSALPSLCLSPRCPASHLVYGPFLAAALHRNLRHQRQQLAVDIGHSCSQWTVGEEDDCGQTLHA